MASKLKVTSRSAGMITHVGPAVRTVDPDEVAKALGAHDVTSTGRPRGTPLTLDILRRDLVTRLRSTGGRPALEGATKIQKIPLRPEDWSQLEEVAGRLSRQGVSATAGQVASILVHTQLQHLRTAASNVTAAKGSARRVVTRRRAHRRIDSRGL